MTKDHSETVPVQYQEGRALFMGMDIYVDPRVFIPRPETELLVSVAADMCRKNTWEKPRILDVGTGSGVIPLGITSILDSCEVMGLDISPDALDVALKNVKRFQREGKISFRKSDMFSALGGESLGAFDAIVSNPPYVSHKDYLELDAWVKAEPKIALYGGHDGLDYYRLLAKDGTWFLKRGGFVAVEVGYDQAARVKTIFRENGFDDVSGFMDFNGYERVITGWKNG